MIAPVRENNYESVFRQPKRTISYGKTGNDVPVAEECKYPLGFSKN
jgi:hypothetical protein